VDVFGQESEVEMRRVAAENVDLNLVLADIGTWTRSTIGKP
jgi:hypothetical protein